MPTTMRLSGVTARSRRHEHTEPVLRVARRGGGRRARGGGRAGPLSSRSPRLRNTTTNGSIVRSERAISTNQLFALSATHVRNVYLLKPAPPNPQSCVRSSELASRPCVVAREVATDQSAPRRQSCCRH
jgi:hypothetical protein